MSVTGDFSGTAHCPPPRRGEAAWGAQYFEVEGRVRVMSEGQRAGGGRWTLAGVPISCLTSQRAVMQMVDSTGGLTAGKALPRGPDQGVSRPVPPGLRAGTCRRPLLASGLRATWGALCLARASPHLCLHLHVAFFLPVSQFPLLIGTVILYRAHPNDLIVT